MAKFIPELWSAELITQMKESLVMAKGARPKRDKYSQMLRDKALGQPEYPPNKTATEIRYAHDHWADAAAYAMANAIDSDIFKQLRDESES
jgi:hypothetical protein